MDFIEGRDIARATDQVRQRQYNVSEVMLA